MNGRPSRSVQQKSGEEWAGTGTRPNGHYVALFERRPFNPRSGFQSGFRSFCNCLLRNLSRFVRELLCGVDRFHCLLFRLSLSKIRFC